VSRLRRRSRVALLAGVVLAATMIAVSIQASGATAVPDTWKRQPTNEEYGLLVLANMARAQPSLDGGTERPVLPMVWSEGLTTGLGASARYHSDDMAANTTPTHSCFQHDSCNGQYWGTRLGHFYSGSSWIGENISTNAADPRYLHTGWMHSPRHRANILNGAFKEFGGGISMGVDGFGPLPLGTEDFGARTSPPSYPKIPAGTVLPRQGVASASRDLIVNYYNHDGPEPSVSAVVNGQRIALARIAGNASNGTYKATRAFSAPGCLPLYFEASAGGSTWRWPATASVLLGVNRTDCAERSGDGTVPPDPGGGGAPGAPTVTISSPANGATVSGTVAITASATDDTKVVTIDIAVDGRRLVRRQTSPVTRKWNAGMRAVQPGTHTITVTAYDDAGNAGTATVTVTK
jgi:uncharacterized protein YkwD